MILSFLEIMFMLVVVLLSSGFFTLFERKVMGSIQFREGPSKVLCLGFFQPVSDAFKLFSKSNLSSETSVDFIYYFSPMMSFFLSMVFWASVPVCWNLVSWYSSFFFIMLCFSISVYGLILSGWFSRSKFASLGCVRALSQSVSYEIPLSMGLVFFMVLFSSSSMKWVSEVQEVTVFIFPFVFFFFLMMVVILAEMNRTPFDLAEGESELVSGFSIELGSSTFIMVFLSEYISLVWACMMMSMMFFGSFSVFVGLKVLMFMFIFIWVRCVFPRVRFDKVMEYCWLMVLPIMIGLFLFYLWVVFNQSQKEAYFC